MARKELKIHHETAKQAAKLGITLVVENGKYVAIVEDHRFTARDAKVALANAIRAQHAIENGEDVDDENDEPASRSIVPPRYKVAYRKFHDTCGDAYIAAFELATHDEDGKLDLNALHSVAKANGVDPSRWAKLNPGQQRMCIGNVLRGLQAHGTDVKIGSETFAGTKSE